MVTTVTPLPTPPNSATNSGTEFDALADAFTAALPTYGTQMNTLASEINVLANAATSAVSATAWSSGTTYASGTVVYSPTTFLNYRSKLGSNLNNVLTNTTWWAPLNASLDSSGLVTVGGGGTGNTTFTSGSLLVGNGTAAVGVASAAQIVAAIGATPVSNATTATNATNASNASTAGYATSAGSAGNISGIAAIVNGGTGSSNAGAARAALGVAASGANTDITSLGGSTTINGHTIGYRNIPKNIQSSGYTVTSSDSGYYIYSTNAGAQTITVPTDATVSIPVNTAISIVNNGTTAITFATGGTVVYKAGTSGAWASGGTLSPRGMCSLLKVDTDTWFINGTGLS